VVTEKASRWGTLKVASECTRDWNRRMKREKGTALINVVLQKKIKKVQAVACTVKRTADDNTPKYESESEGSTRQAK